MNRMKSIYLFFLVAILFLVISCVDLNNSKTDNNQINNYEIIKKEVVTSEKFSIDLRIDKKLSEEEIRKIAEEIKQKNPKFKRYFICYYLPDMEIDKGAWATSHIDPEISIQFLGATKEESNVLLNSNIPEGEIVG